MTIYHERSQKLKLMEPRVNPTWPYLLTAKTSPKCKSGSDRNASGREASQHADVSLKLWKSLGNERHKAKKSKQFYSQLSALARRTGKSSNLPRFPFVHYFLCCPIPAPPHWDCPTQIPKPLLNIHHARACHEDTAPPAAHGLDLSPLSGRGSPTRPGMLRFFWQMKTRDLHLLKFMCAWHQSHKSTL